jgi:hypothetical protein
MYQGLGDQTVLNYPTMPDFTPVMSAVAPVVSAVEAYQPNRYRHHHGWGSTRNVLEIWEPGKWMF